MNLLEETQSLLADARKTASMESIARECDVTLSWLQKFYRGEIENPGVVTIQRVRDRLAKKAVA